MPDIIIHLLRDIYTTFLYIKLLFRQTHSPSK